MAAHRSLSSLSFGTRVNSVLTPPAGIANDDILVLALFVQAQVTPTPPSGFAQWLDIDVTVGDFDVWVWWKRASSESGSYTVTHASTGTEGYLCAISGAATSGTPEDPAPSSNIGSSSEVTALSVTPTVDNDLIIFAQANGAGAGLDPPAGSTPTFTERFDSTAMYVADGGLAAAQATGDKTQTILGNLDWGAALISVKDAGGAAAPSPFTLMGQALL